MVGFIEYDGTAVGLTVGGCDGRRVGADNEFDGFDAENQINNMPIRTIIFLLVSFVSRMNLPLLNTTMTVRIQQASCRQRDKSRSMVRW